MQRTFRLALAAKILTCECAAICRDVETNAVNLGQGGGARFGMVIAMHQMAIKIANIKLAWPFDNSKSNDAYQWAVGAGRSAGGDQIAVAGHS